LELYLSLLYVSPVFLGKETPNATCDEERLETKDQRGRSNPQDVLEVPDQKVFIRPSGTRLRYGTIGLGIDHAPLVWKDADHVFTSHDSFFESHKQEERDALKLGSPHRLSAQILNQQPVDCLLVEGCEPSIWQPWIERMDEMNRPRVILSWTDAQQLGQDEDYRSKITCKKNMGKFGYHTTYWFLEAWKYGPALD
jgi:hypothetical protein